MDAQFIKELDQKITTIIAETIEKVRNNSPENEEYTDEETSILYSLAGILDHHSYRFHKLIDTSHNKKNVRVLNVSIEDLIHDLTKQELTENEGN